MSQKLVQIQCCGRGPTGETVLQQPVGVTVRLSSPGPGPMISVGPTDCPYNTGGHGQRCKASHPEKDKVGAGVLCPFSFDYPYAQEFPGWTMPTELIPAMAELGVS